MKKAHRAPASCLDCNATLHGPCCSQCGQRVRDPNPTLRELAAEAWDAFASVDGRALATLKILITRPGGLTAEYLAGRRTRYFAPLRVYLVCSFLFFFMNSALPDMPSKRTIARKARADSISAADHTPAIIARQDSVRRVFLTRARLPMTHGGPLTRAVRIRADSLMFERGLREKRLLPAWLAPHAAASLARMRNHESREVDFKEILPRLMFVLMPVFALLLARAYRRRQLRYPTHLIMSLHLHAFAFLTFIIDRARSRMIPDGPWWTEAPALVWLLVYLVLALRRVYGGRLGYAALRATVIVAGYAVFGMTAVILIMFYQNTFA